MIKFKAWQIVVFLIYLPYKMFKEMSEKNPYKYNGDALVVENINDNIKTKSVYIESYGCAMNFSDSEIVASILSKNGYKTSDDLYTSSFSTLKIISFTKMPLL